MGHYKANLRDIEFNLFEVLQRQDILGQGLYEDVDRETAHEVLAQAVHLAENDLAASLLDSDRNPPVYDPATYSVTMPDSFRASYQAYLDSELWRMDLPASLDGIVVPPSLRWATSELVLGANPAVHMFSAVFSFARILHEIGTPDQRRIAELMVEKFWGATMVLTEPDAGSDVGAGRTKAVQQPDGTWHLTGVKRFITSAESDFQDNVIHFVLARPEGAAVGTKGLSLFIVPKFHIDLETGELGDRNGVFTTNLEHKMGLKVSTTCELTFGDVDGIPAVGTLLGDVHDGIAQMFRVIEYARMMVGTKAIATLSTGYLNALDYAKTRVQGPDLTHMMDKSAPRVTITHHPDVRRSLMLQKAYAEGLRALVLYTAAQQDTVDQLRRRGLPVEPGSPEDLATRVNDLLLPVVKGVGSERAWVVLGTESLQTYGGSGFLQGYPIEQYVRDAKIDTLYEGTTAIQGMDFFFRKIVRDKGAALAWMAGEILETVKGENGTGQLATERALLGQALDDVQGIVGFMVDQVYKAQRGNPAAMYAVGQNTTRLLLACGDLVVGWLLVRHAEVALAALDRPDLAARDQRFYEGKVAAARFFTRTVLPRLTAEKTITTLTDNGLMEVDEAAF